jgi:predicted PurR-regulated permease PerM
MLKKEYPFFIKSTVTLFGLILLTYTLLNLRDILTPLAFAVIIGILLNPLVNRFQKKKIPKMLSIIFAMLLAILLIGGIAFFLSTQIAQFSDTIPLLSKKAEELMSQLQAWLNQAFGISIQKQVQLINEAANGSKALVGQTLGTAVGILGVVFLIPVYVFLFLWYKRLIIKFL